MSVDLNFWKYEKDIYLDPAAVYQKACCDQEEIKGLTPLPIQDILSKVASAFADWNALDPLNYENPSAQGSFQISTTLQTIRFDCYSMAQADMKRFSSIMSEFGCPLYDPQRNMRFDKICLFLIDEMGSYQAQAEQEISRLLPHMEIETQITSWDEYLRISKTLAHVQYSAVIHRAKTLTKITSFIDFGKGWANRPCQCKTAQLADKEKEPLILEELLRKSIERVVKDFLEKTYYEA